MHHPINHSAEFQERLLHHGSKDEQIARLKECVWFWRAVAALTSATLLTVLIIVRLSMKTP